MLLKKLMLVGVAGVVLSGCSLLGESGETAPAAMESEPTEAMMEAESESMMKDESMDEGAMMEEGMMEYTIADVAEHNTVDDCWVIVNDTVHDVSTFAQSGKHPGGDISGACGTDATEMFFNRPNGTAHSQEAQDYLATMKLGTVAK